MTGRDPEIGKRHHRYVKHLVPLRIEMSIRNKWMETNGAYDKRHSQIRQGILKGNTGLEIVMQM